MSPYSSLCDDSIEVRDKLNEVLSTRIREYHKHYNCKTLPVHAVDYIADHTLLCDDDENIIMAFRSVTIDTCERFNVLPPLYTVLSDNKNPADVLANVKSLVSRERNAMYHGSLFRNTRVDLGRRDTALTWEILTSSILLSIYEKGYSTFCFAANSSDKYLGRIGFEMFCKTQVYEPSLCYAKVNVRCFPKGKEISIPDRYLALWENRKIVGGL